MLFDGMDMGRPTATTVPGRISPDGRMEIINLKRRPRWRRVLRAPWFFLVQYRLCGNARAAWGLTRLLWDIP